jgi:3-phenylpropionate/cinnamic acid dioxygenase small subunit
VAGTEEVPFEKSYAIDKFLIREARLLDEEKYQEWLALLTEDVRYRMPIPRNTQRNNRPGTSTLHDGAIYDEDFASLKQRVAREETGLVWLNDPPTRHVRLISNIETEATETPGVYKVRSKFTLLRNRRERDAVSHVGSREDLIRDTAEGFRIAERTIHLPERVVIDKNLNLFF